MSLIRTAVTLLLCVHHGNAGADKAAAKVTPVQKVIQLLDGMVEQGIKEKQAEEVQFAAYSSFCESTIKDKKRLIKKNNELIETLEADIQKHEADADLLAKEISGLDTDITTWEGDLKASTKVRAIERLDYENTHKDYTESMEALEEGIQTITKGSEDTAQAEGEGPTSAALAEGGAAMNQIKKAPMIPDAAKKAIAAFLAVGGTEDAYEAENMAIVSGSEQSAQVFNENARLLKDAIAKHDLTGSEAATHGARDALKQVASSDLLPAGAQKAIQSFLQVHGPDYEDDENLAVAAPEANAYEFQAQGVVDMLSHLNEKFFTEREALEKKELESRHAFGVLQQDLNTQVKGATEAREEKKVAKSKSLQAAADAKGDLRDTIGTRDDDMKYLADLTATCDEKATAFEKRQQLRSEELTAVKKAIEILSGDAVSGASEKHLPQLLQVHKKHAALVQLRSSSENPTSQQRVAMYLKQQSTRLNSRVLSTIAMRIATDPFKKVKKMVKDLIVKLMEQANEEADHKGWCDMELGTNGNTREEKTTSVETLTAEIDELKASVAKLAEDIAGLADEIKLLEADVAKATAIRNEEHEKNTIAIKDAQEAQKAIDSALDTLNDFYGQAAQATSLVQPEKPSLLQNHKGHGKQPEIFDEPYKGMGGENGGVIGMLEVIDADFQHLESTAKAQEDEASKEYFEFIGDSNVNKAKKQSDFDHMTGMKQNQEQALQERTKDLAGTQKELDAANAYFDKLKGSCMAQPESYEERVARRKEEIESLQEALRILQGEEVI